MKAFVKKEAVLCIAFLCAVVSMFLVPPDGGYADYVDYRVLALLFCLMLVVAGLQDCGLFDLLARRLLAGEKRFRFLALALVLLPFFSSMLITNDVSLITFVPFAVLVLELTGRQAQLPYIVTLQTVAANLGSMAMPVGNPQNLFLCSKFGIPMGGFFAAVLPLTAVSLVGLVLAAGATSGDIIQVRFQDAGGIGKPGQLKLMLLLFALCLLSIFHVLPWPVLLAVVILAAAVFARHLFPRVDYALLCTFVCFFVFSGNLGRMEGVRTVLTGLMERNTVVTSALASQVISNVPAALLLSGFTNDWQGLLIGCNLGGLGTLIASMASLISYKMVAQNSPERRNTYLVWFTVCNVGMLALLLLLNWIL